MENGSQDYLYRFEVYLSLNDREGRRVEHAKLLEIRNLITVHEIQVV